MGGFHLFTLANVPVWISPWFLLIPLLLVQSRGMKEGLLITFCILASLLVHEFGHALVAKRYKLGPSIVLHGFGGYTGHQRARTNGEDALIIAAGPFAGLTLGIVCFGVLYALLPAQHRSLDNALLLAIGGISSQNVSVTIGLVGQLALLNVIWTAFNLLPLYPMDGGQLFRLGMLKLVKPVTAERVTHIVGLAVIAAIALGAYLSPFIPFGPFTMVILAMMALRNIQGLTGAGAGSEPVRRDNKFARELMSSAERAYQEGNDEEAARLCHQIRAEGNVPPQVLARTWAMLGVIATRKGEYEEALSYLRRAPDAADVVEATAQCFYQLEMFDALTALTQTKAFGRLPSDTREQILGALREASA